MDSHPQTGPPSINNDSLLPPPSIPKPTTSSPLISKPVPSMQESSPGASFLCPHPSLPSSHTLEVGLLPSTPAHACPSSVGSGPFRKTRLPAERLDNSFRPLSPLPPLFNGDSSVAQLSPCFQLPRLRSVDPSPAVGTDIGIMGSNNRHASHQGIEGIRSQSLNANTRPDACPGLQIAENIPQPENEAGIAVVLPVSEVTVQPVFIDGSSRSDEEHSMRTSLPAGSLIPPACENTVLPTSNRSTIQGEPPAETSSLIAPSPHTQPSNGGVPIVGQGSGQSPPSDHSRQMDALLPGFGNDHCERFVREMTPKHLKLYFGESVSPETKKKTRHLQQMFLNIVRPGPVRDAIDLRAQIYEENRPGDQSARRGSGSEMVTAEFPSLDSEVVKGGKEVYERERKSQIAFRLYKDVLPPEIWHYCQSLCFALIATDPTKVLLLEELVNVHEIANSLHAAFDIATQYVETRRRGIGGSHIAFVAASREERQRESGRFIGTKRQRALRRLADFVTGVLPFLYGMVRSPSGTVCPEQKLCTKAICCLLGISRNFLYGRKNLNSNLRTGTESGVEIASILDNAGVRLRQHRRNGSRHGYASMDSLQSYECGCSEPCWAGVPLARLESEYKSFTRLAPEMRPRRKENRFLLDAMFCPLSNCTVKQCDRSLSQLFAVSKGVVADIRRTLDSMCSDPSLEDRPLIQKGGYYKHLSHPMNRYNDQIRVGIENHLNMILRADPAGSNGVNVCRVYSPEVNTQQKLRSLLMTLLSSEDVMDGNKEASRSTVQRMVNNYLDARNLRILFKQTDHNACPNCKTLQYAVMQYHHEGKTAQKELDRVQEDVERSSPEAVMAKRERVDSLRLLISTKLYQEQEGLREIKVHNGRDCFIRHYVKKLSDHFRAVENRYREASFFNDPSQGWNSMRDHASISHQDEMSKVDLPYFVGSASADITRWRFDANAHVSAVSNSAVVFSHEQGTGSKNASAIIEEILLEHVLNCRGESIKVVVSDNASVGKNWLTTVTLPQYMVDQRLVDVALVIFLENNHGKWLADMRFGQLQSRRKRSTLISVDDLLTEFESINRRSGKVRGFAVNPLSSVDLSQVFSALGYEIKPPKEFAFTKRNIHFSAACKPGVKARLPPPLKKILGPALPDAPGMVRVSSSPPSDKPQCELLYQDRYIDVPAARLSQQMPRNAPSNAADATSDSRLEGAPLVVPLNKPYSPSGNGVVSNRTAHHVGFNGIAFRKLPAFPELRNNSNGFVQRAWPAGLRQRYEYVNGSGEPIHGAETVLCAPENWVLRRPVGHFRQSDGVFNARYPPSNLLNAMFQNGPREATPWIPKATYHELPFLVVEGTASFTAMKRLADKHVDINKSVHVLDVLKAIFEEMGNRGQTGDQWLHKYATVPGMEAVENYRNELRIFTEREKGYPSAPSNVKQCFKQDAGIQQKVSDIVREEGIPETDVKKKTKIFNKLFGQAEITPGSLDMFRYLVSKDLERFAQELKGFRETQTHFDKEHDFPYSIPSICEAFVQQLQSSIPTV